MTRLSFILLLLGVALAPLPLGSDRPWAWPVLALVVALAMLAWSISALRGHHRGLPQGDRWLVTGLVLASAVGLWIWVQAYLPVPEQLAAPHWRQLRAVAGIEAQAAIGADRAADFAAALRLATYGAVLFLAWELARARARAIGILWCLSVAIVGYAAFGMAVLFADLRSLGFWPKIAFVYDVTGTLVNRNHFATLLGIGIFASLALIYGVLRRAGWRHAGLAEILPTLSGRSRATLVWGLVALLVDLAALFLTHSRGGFLTIAIALAVVLVLALALGHVRWQGGVALAMIGGLAFLAIGQISGGGLWARLIENGLVDVERASYVRDTLAMIGERPLLGWGLGAYESIFNGMRAPPDIARYYYVDRAHNTYLELAAELGLPGAIALVMAASLPGLICLIAVFRRRASAFALAGTGVTVAVGLHAWFDFSMQVPAVAIAYFALAGACASQCISAPARPQRRRRARHDESAA